MPKQETQLQQMKPYLIVAGILFVVVIALFFWPTNEQGPSAPVIEPIPVITTPEASAEQTEIESEVPEPETYTPLPELQEVVIGDTEEVSPSDTVEPITELEIETQVLDISDNAVRLALQRAIANTKLLSLLVNDDLLQKFVINVNNLANQESSPRNELVTAPQNGFSIYRQAQSSFIEPDSFRRFAPYVDILESMDVDAMIALLGQYRGDIEQRYAEISRPNASFDEALIEAIDTLLDTPEVPLPIEVYSDSVAYKFKDPRLEALPAPQKQLLRTGKDNMRRIKAVLRELKDALEAQ